MSRPMLIPDTVEAIAHMFETHARRTLRTGNSGLVQTLARLAITSRDNYVRVRPSIARIRAQTTAYKRSLITLKMHMLRQIDMQTALFPIHVRFVTLDRSANGSKRYYDVVFFENKVALSRGFAEKTTLGAFQDPIELNTYHNFLHTYSTPSRIYQTLVWIRGADDSIDSHRVMGRKHNQTQLTKEDRRKIESRWALLEHARFDA